MKKLILVLAALCCTFSFISCGDDEEIEPSTGSSGYKYVTTVSAIYIIGGTAKSSRVEIYKMDGKTYCCPPRCTKRLISKNTSKTWENVTVKQFNSYYNGSPRYFFNY